MVRNTAMWRYSDSWTKDFSMCLGFFQAIFYNFQFPASHLFVCIYLQVFHSFGSTINETVFLIVDFAACHVCLFNVFPSLSSLGVGFWTLKVPRTSIQWISYKRFTWRGEQTPHWTLRQLYSVKDTVAYCLGIFSWEDKQVYSHQIRHQQQTKAMTPPNSFRVNHWIQLGLFRGVKIRSYPQEHGLLTGV